MALQAALPPTDSNEFRRTALLRRLAEVQSRSPAAPKAARRGALSWDPAEFLGVSPTVMMGICAQVGASLGLLLYSTFQIASQASPSSPPQAIAIEAAPVETGPETYVVVPDFPETAQVVDDYYFYLRQGMYDRAWELTDAAFRQDNYGAGFEAYQQNWAGAQAMEVLSMDLVWQGSGEAHLLGVIQEGASGIRWRNSYILRLDEASSLWKIHAISPAG